MFFLKNKKIPAFLYFLPAPFNMLPRRCLLFSHKSRHTHTHTNRPQQNFLKVAGCCLFCFFTKCGRLKGPVVYNKSLSWGAATWRGGGIQNKKSRSVSLWRAFYFVFIWAHDFYLPPSWGESCVVPSSSSPAYLLSPIFTWCPAAAASTRWRPEKAGECAKLYKAGCKIQCKMMTVLSL